MILTIEYCVNCSKHQWNTRHNEARYRDLFNEFELKFNDLGYNVIAVKRPRLGTFEISLGEFVLFSKLETGQFPDVDSVVKLVDDFSHASDKKAKYK